MVCAAICLLLQIEIARKALKIESCFSERDEIATKSSYIESSCPTADFEQQKVQYNILYHAYNSLTHLVSFSLK
jgi:hypothetical protein